MEALNKVSADLRILACTQDSFTSFAPLAQECCFEIFAGPKEDVLERYRQVIRKFSLDRVIRATGDNPFVFADAATALFVEAKAENADYASYTGLPHGAGVEVILSSALLRAAEEATLSFEREHVCPYLYNHPELFKLHRPAAPEQWNYPDIRLTIDTQEDYDRAAKLYSALKDDPNKHNGSVILNTYFNHEPPQTIRTCDLKAL
jgi:spore coat polysaccharide biosynthesis protein SpsF